MSLLPEVVRMFRQMRDRAIGDMARKRLDLPMEVAKAFVRDMRAFYAEPNSIKRDEIAARQLQALRQYQGPREKKLRITDVIEMFRQMRDKA